MKKFYEKDLEEIIFNASDDQLYDKGLCINGRRFRQLRIGNYGRLDLMTVSREFCPGSSRLNITIYELKEDKVGVGAFLQSIGYAKGIQRYLETRKFYDYILNIVLIGGEVDTSGNLCFIPDLVNSNNEFHINDTFLSSVSFYDYKYGLEGIEFSPISDLKLTKEGF